MESTTTTTTPKTNRKDCFNGRIGTSFESKTWLSLDPCGLMGVLCSLSVHVFAYITNALHLIEGSFVSTAIYLLVYTPITFLAVISLYMAWTTNPGAIPMGARPLVAVKRAGSQEISMMEEGGSSRSSKRAIRRCHKCCDNFKPPRAHHDSVTGRCIVKFDHFCPWVGNAVGGLNHKFFVLFIGYTLASCIVTLLMMILRTLHCNNSQQQQQQSKSSSSSLSSNNNADETDLSHNNNNNNNIPEEDQTRRRHYLLESSSLEGECEGWFEAWSVLILLIVSVIFMIFTCCMLFEQIETIQTNSSKIARMKMKVGQAGTELERVTEEFNEMFGGNSNKVALHWFLPLQVEFPRGMKKAVLGYEWDECFDPIPYEEPGSNNGGTDNNNINNNGTTSLGDAGGGGGGNNNNINVKIELTSVVGGGRSPPRQLSSSPVPPANIIGGEEDNFTGTPVKKKPPTNNLTKRSNSRDPDKRPQGTLT